MPHEHHTDCGHESHDHDHSHELTSDMGSQDNLFLQIDRDNVVALNTSSTGSDVIKPWHTRLDETQVTGECFIVDRNSWRTPQVYRIWRGRSNVGKHICHQLLCYKWCGYNRILRIPFTGSVRLRALLLKAGPGAQTPSKVNLVCPQLPSVCT